MDKMEKVLVRGVEQILPSKKGLVELMRKRKITLYQGFDPSSPSLHLGNLIGIRKLAQFQSLGHKVVFLIGDFTGTIGDPTDRPAARKKLTRKQVLENAKGYKQQISKILNFNGSNPAKIKFNSAWLSKLSFEEVTELASNFTVQQMLERDFFQARLKKERPIYLHEFLYPLMQGYDSAAMNVDLEIGGNDQLFNMMAGRVLIRSLKGKEKFVLTMKLLEDPTGAKMGKTKGNTINLTDEPNDVFGKIMSLPDTLIERGTELLTDLPLNLAKKEEPLTAKRKLAFEIIKQLHGKKVAVEAREYFDRTFRKKAPEYKREAPLQTTLVDIVKEEVGSKSEAKRLIQQGAVDVNEVTVTNPAHKMKGGERLKIGKKIFVKVIKK